MNRFSDGIKVIAEVHPQIQFCRSGIIVKVTRGKGLIYEVCSRDRLNQLRLNDEILYTSDVDDTGSYQDMILLGYGTGYVPNEVLQSSVAQVNSVYSKLSQAVEAIYPLLNLLECGSYFIGDFDLFPVQKEGRKIACFWNLPERHGCYWPYSELAEWCDGYNVQPLYLIPTQSAKCMNPERVRTYMQLLDQNPDQMPRAIGLYLRGSGVLLLDGHHKALAAAAKGVPAKTLVIAKLKEENILTAAEQGKRLFLRRKLSTLKICDQEELYYSTWKWFGFKERDVNLEIPYYKVDKETWGYIDKQWIAEMKNPDMMSQWILRTGTELSNNVIKELIDKLQKMPLDEHWMYRTQLRQLICYAKLNLESKWITPSQRQWLMDMNDKV